MTDTQAPSARLLVGELGVARDWWRSRARPTVQTAALSADVAGHDAPVMTLPGFCAGDISMRQMRQSLRSAGFRARGWRMGANLGARADTLARIDARVQDIAQREGRAVHLVGWSLGGVFAREYAAQYPGAVASVVTMGSPFAGDPRANNAWRLYRLVTGHSVDNPPITRSPLAKPPVPTFALWSPRDGIVAPASARGTGDQRDEAIELDVRHLSFAFSAPVIRTVIDCMVRADQQRRT